MWLSAARGGLSYFALCGGFSRARIFARSLLGFVGESALSRSSADEEGGEVVLSARFFMSPALGRRLAPPAKGGGTVTGFCWPLGWRRRLVCWATRAHSPDHWHRCCGSSLGAFVTGGGAGLFHLSELRSLDNARSRARSVILTGRSDIGGSHHGRFCRNSACGWAGEKERSLSGHCGTVDGSGTPTECRLVRSACSRRGSKGAPQHHHSPRRHLSRNAAMATA